MLPVVLHIPHASTEIPDDERAEILLDDKALAAELVRMTDLYTDTIFEETIGSNEIHYRVSRLVVDPERFEDDAQERAAEVGMGVIYTKTPDGGTLRSTPTPERRQALLDRYYRPHHREFTETVDRLLDRDRTCLVIDCHSFPAEPVPFEMPSDGTRPEICIGTDPFHTPPELRDAAVKAFGEKFDSVRVDYPFAGSIVPLKHYGKDARVFSVMIEVGRWLFQDEKTGEKLATFGEVRDRVRRCVFEMYVAFVTSLDERDRDGGKDREELIRGSYMDGPELDPIDWSGLDLTDRQREIVRGQVDPVDLFEECGANLELRAEEGAGPGMSDTYFEFVVGVAAMRRELRENIAERLRRTTDW